MKRVDSMGVQDALYMRSVSVVSNTRYKFPAMDGKRVLAGCCSLEQRFGACGRVLQRPMIIFGAMGRFLLFSLLLAGAEIFAQGTFPSNGAPFTPRTTYAFTHANIQVDADVLLRDATLVIRDNRVIDCGTAVRPPDHAVTIDLKGKYVYPSFIDLFSDYGLPATPPARAPATGHLSQNRMKKAPSVGTRPSGRTWMRQKLVMHQAEKADDLRKPGFGVVLCGPEDRIVRGQGLFASVQQRSP